MPPTVLSDLTWLLPKVLQKVPWQIRALFLAVITVYGLYAIGAQIFAWPLSKGSLELLGILAVPAGLPALSNVTVHKGTKPNPQAVEKSLEDLYQQVRAEFMELHARLDNRDDAKAVAESIRHDLAQGLRQDLAGPLAEELHDRLKMATAYNDLANANLDAAQRASDRGPAPVKKAPAKRPAAKAPAKKAVAKKAAKK